ncbi:retron system putative HNH endonuclease [Vibrio campbellii]|uniref:retron system putative HNH endonuclease n=1 Tax=Vibrio campbellii TaxID=680 RepID=UPI000CD348B0|nr:retron system putative HNH endonuclease [Vibrio campbellii]AUW02643.1 TIGR02646 family protein [Vibrio campbellii]
MRTVIKTELGTTTLDRQNNKIGRPTTSAEADERWGSLKKTPIRNRLLGQQYFLCAMTEFNINDFKSKADSKHGCHLEHIKPRSKFPELTFEYENIVISVLDDLDQRKFKQDFFIGEEAEEDLSHQLWFGAKAKDDELDEALFISPVEQDCQRYFAYIEHSGEIMPANGLEEDEVKRAEYTIKLLNLNHPYLKNQRYKRMQEVLEDIEELDDLDEQIDIVRDEISERNGQIASFPSAVQSLVAGA